jgi:hypothetical protein
MLYGMMSMLIAIPTVAQQATLLEIKNNLQSVFMEGLYQRTYYSLLDRVDSDGFLQESLTGRLSLSKTLSQQNTLYIA